MRGKELETKHNLSPILTENLLNMYGFDSEVLLYKYLYMKCSISKGRKKVSERDLLKFTIEELNITIHKDNGEYLIYKDEVHSLYELSMEFLENLVFRANMFGEVNIEDELDVVFRRGYSRSSKFRKLPEYKSYIEYNRLLVLNEAYNVESAQPPEIEGFQNGINHNPFRRSLEERLEASLDASRFLGSQTTAHVSEEDVEDFIVENIELVEEGMRYIDRQVKVSGGIIDILAMDSYGKICIIEVKIEHDKSIVWQAMHYPKEIRSEWPRKEIRMITISPSYSEHVLEKLKSMDGVETKAYSINVSFNEIKQLRIYTV